MDAVTASDALEKSSAEPRARKAAGRSDGGKWPLVARAAFITGSAAALWGLIWLGYKSL